MKCFSYRGSGNVEAFGQLDLVEAIPVVEGAIENQLLDGVRDEICTLAFHFNPLAQRRLERKKSVLVYKKFDW